MIRCFVYIKFLLPHCSFEHGGAAENHPLFMGGCKMNLKEAADTI